MNYEIITNNFDYKLPYTCLDWALKIPTKYGDCIFVIEGSGMGIWTRMYGRIETDKGRLNILFETWSDLIKKDFSYIMVNEIKEQIETEYEKK